MNTETQIQSFRQTYSTLRDEIGKVIVGHDEIVEGTLISLFAGGHILLEGVPGLGKTLLVRTLSEVLDLSFNRIQFTPDLMPADILGTNLVNETPEGRREFQFQRGPIFAHLVLADEINRATPKTQSALLEAMQEKQVTAGGEIRKLAEPFFVLATQNPIDQEGTYPLPEAQLDRFLLKVVVPYASRADLTEILARTTAPTAARFEVRQVITAQEIAFAQALARCVLVAPHVQDFAVRIVLATHPSDAASDFTNRMVSVGSSPRGAQGLVASARVRALLRGRSHASTQDIAAVSRSVLRHRIARSFEAEAAGVTTDDIIEGLLGETPAEAQP